jgi:branched-chain amino acid transport system ATP-binding protein
METILKTQNVSKSFYGLKAVNNVSLDINKGEIFGLIGPNGAGKTTFFNAISGFDAPTSGTVIYNGKDMTNATTVDYVNEGLARTFQNIRIFPEMTVVQNIAVGLHKHTDTNLFHIISNDRHNRRVETNVKNRSNEIMERLGISKYANENASDLPYGTQRILEIGRALASDPNLLLLDEPSAGMNTQESIELVRLVFRIHEYVPTIIVIEHNMRFIMELCDKIAVLNFGELLALGTPNEIQCNEKVLEAYLGKEDK